LPHIMDKAGQLINQLGQKLTEVPSLILSSSPTNMVSAVTFCYAPPSLSKSEHLVLLNKLNEQILLDLNDVAANPLALTLVNENGINYMSFQPLLNQQQTNTISPEMIDKLVDMIRVDTSLIDATLNCQQFFAESIQQYDGLKSVEASNFVGLGAVQYVPSYLAEAVLSEEVKKEIDGLNATLAARLHDIDAIFSEGRAVDGSVCVCLGVGLSVVTPEIASQHAKTIYKIASQQKLSDKLVEKISEVIQKGIKQAEEELTQEERDIAYQQGMLRHLPVVGPLVNWWSPSEKPKMKGRSFHLASQNLARSPHATHSTPSDLNLNHTSSENHGEL